MSATARVARVIYDLVIIGGGAAGSEAAFAVADRISPGLLLAEASHFGGTCTNHGCVPTKALVRAARLAHEARQAGRFGLRLPEPEVDWPSVIGRARHIRDLMLRHGTKPFVNRGVEVRYPARARLAGERRVEIDGDLVEAKAILVATGLEPAVPPVPGLRESDYLDNETVLELARLPESMAVIGSGPIGSEFAQVFSRLGVRVTVIEALERLLPPEEPESGQAMLEAFNEEGIQVRTGVRMTQVSRVNGASRIDFEDGGVVEAEAILVAAGRKLDGAGVGLDVSGVEWSPHGIKVDATLRTNQDWVWAAGDVAGGPLFTHVASEMGPIAARNAVLGTAEEIDLRIVPRVTFTDPEVASVGMTEAQAAAAGHVVRVGFARVVDSEKGEIDGNRFGHVKVVADAASGELLGCHIMAPTAGDMIHEAVAIMAGRVPVRVAGQAMHAYPTFSEMMRSALREAAG